MPDAARRARQPPKPATLVLTSLGGVVAGILVFLVVLAITGPKSAKQSQGARFKVGSAERLATVADREGPFLFPDLLNRSRDIFVQHVAGDQWLAFEAHAPGAPRRCVLRWQPATRDFVDPCSGRTYPFDGAGLRQYPATVDEDGTLYVDLSTTASRPDGTSNPTDTSTVPTSAASVP